MASFAVFSILNPGGCKQDLMDGGEKVDFLEFIKLGWMKWEKKREGNKSNRRFDMVNQAITGTSKCFLWLQTATFSTLHKG